MPETQGLSGIAFKYRETSVEAGRLAREVSLAGGRIAPLGFEELLRYRPGRPVQMRLAIDGARVLESNIDGLEPGTTGRVSCELDSHYASSLLALRPGGWLPAGFALDENALLLPDRNVLASLMSRFGRGRDRAVEAPDFLDFFAGRAVRITPLLFALESDAQRQPTYDEAGTQLFEAADALRKYLPEASILGVDAYGLKGLFGLLDDTGADMERKQQFFLSIAPSLAGPVARQNVERSWRATLEAADACGVRRGSLAVLAALSVVVAPQARSPARRIVKFSQSYTAADAYNALADLRALEVFTVLLAMYPDTRIDLCTADQPLARFWAGLKAKDFSLTNGVATYVHSACDVLLPGTPHDLWQAWSP